MPAVKAPKAEPIAPAAPTVSPPQPSPLEALRVTDEQAKKTFSFSSTRKESTFIKSHKENTTKLREYLNKRVPGWNTKPKNNIELLKLRSEFSKAIREIGDLNKHSTFNKTVKIVDEKKKALHKSGLFKRLTQKLDDLSHPRFAEPYKNQTIRANYTLGPNGRAYARPDLQEMFFAVGDSRETVYHEFGHLLEGYMNNGMAQKAEFWRKWRSIGDASGRAPVKPLNDLVRSRIYGDTEVAIVDKFIDPYVGKAYGQGWTEVYSMGLQQFTSEASVMSFAKKDFDHFAFIFNTLRGAT
jgi:hypothetical protein